MESHSLVFEVSTVQCLLDQNVLSNPLLGPGDIVGMKVTRRTLGFCTLSIGFDNV